MGRKLGGVGRSVWRAFKRLTLRRSRRHLTASVSATAAGHPQHLNNTHTPATEQGGNMPFWAVPLFSTPSSPFTWLQQSLPWLVEQQQQQQQQPGATVSSAAVGHTSTNNKPSRRSQRKARRLQKKAQKQLQREMQRSKKAASRAASSSAAAASPAAGRGTHALAHMVNTANTFPMLLYSAQHLKQQQQQQHNQSEPSAWQQQQQHSGGALHAPRGSSSSNQQQQQPWSPQQLLTVGCRHWGNWWDGRGLLRVKILDFAIYCDGSQAAAHLSNARLTPDAAGAQQPLSLQQQQQTGMSLQQQQQVDLDVPGSSGSSDLAAALTAANQVEMSLVLKAARDVPLHLLAAEYEKVLHRRLDRVGGSQEDVSALKQLLASFSDVDRLPAAVVSSSPSSKSSSSGSEQKPATVRKGAMIVFERSRTGDVTARVGPVILGTVSSPKVAEALFNLYLGGQPVSRSAKEAAAQTLQRIAASAAVGATSQGNSSGSSSDRSAQPALAPYYLPSSKGHRIKCEGRVARSSSSKQPARVAVLGDESAALSVEELDVCELHMG